MRTLPAVLAQRFEQLQLAGRGVALDFLLSPEQELALWAAVVEDDEVLAIDAPEAAALAAREAWRGLHAWHLNWPPAPALINDDVAAFQRWSTHYLERCRALRVTDHARLLSAGGEPLATTLAWRMVSSRHRPRWRALLAAGALHRRGPSATRFDAARLCRS